MTFSAQLAIITVTDGLTGLSDTLESLHEQVDTRWQWCLVTTGGPAIHRQVFDWAARDPRVLVVDGTPLPPTELLSLGLGIADAEHVCRMEAGDTLDPGLVLRLRDLDDGQWAYTDEAMRYPQGMGTEPWFKPEFCPELQRSQPYTVRSAMLPLATVQQLGGVRERAGTAQWYDLVLRVCEAIGPPEHITGPYYLRAAQQQPVLPPWLDATPADRCRVVGDHCDRLGIAVSEIAPVTAEGRDIGQRIRRRLDDTPLVSLVIPTRGGTSTIYGFPRCHVVEMLRSLWTDERYPALEVVVVYDAATPQPVLDDLQEITDGDIVLVPFTEPFHFSRKCNAGALAASGEYLCFLNDDMQVVTPDWLHEMMSLLADPEVGAVGPKLLFADGTLQHAGHEYDGGQPHHLLFRRSANSAARGGLAQLTGERAGLTGACLLMRTAQFVEIGGFSDLFPLNFNDVDLCLKVGGLGLRLLYTPHAVLDHYESQTREARVDPMERRLLERRWDMALHEDPIVNPLRRLPILPHRVQIDD